MRMYTELEEVKMAPKNGTKWDPALGGGWAPGFDFMSLLWDAMTRKEYLWKVYGNSTDGKPILHPVLRVHDGDGGSSCSWVLLVFMVWRC